MADVTRSPWALTFGYLRAHRRGLWLIVALLVVDVALNVLAPWPLKLIVDGLLVHQPLPDAVQWLTTLLGATSPVGLLGWLALASLLFFAGRQGVLVAQHYVQAGVGTRMKLALAGDIFLHLQRLSLIFHGANRTGDLVARVTNDADAVRLLLLGVLLPALTAGTTLAVMFVVMLGIDPGLAVLALAAALPMPLLMRWFTPRMAERAFEQYQAEGALAAHAEQTMSALPVIQAFGREPLEDRRFRGMSAAAIGAHLRAISSQLQYGAAVGLTTAVGTAAVMIMGGLHVQQGLISIGGLLVFLAYLTAIYEPLETLANLSTAYANANGQARRVQQVLAADERVVEAADARAFTPRVAGAGLGIAFQAVTFGYQPGRPVLRGLDLVVTPGETVALVGSTGSGKSTLASLVPRFYDPWSGQVLVNDQDVRGLKLSDLRAQVALVLQEPFLLPLTIAENIAYARPGASRDEIIRAAEAANADEFIRRLPAGYDTPIGERGAGLSGGQRQRLAIARALLKDAPILILDEPTSALDNRTEALIMDALQRLMSHRTTLIIAHRLSTLRDADRVIKLRDGQVMAGIH